MSAEIIVGPDGKSRCRWCDVAPEFLVYHDTEWGFPVGDDQRLFEKLCLEGFQSGLSWRTILAKRENFRAAFHDFDFGGIDYFVQRFKENGLEIRRPHHGVCLHASNGADQRSYRGLRDQK